MQRNRFCPQLSELYTLGIPQINFNKTGKPSTSHTSGHLPVDEHHTCEFSCLNDYGPETEIPEVFQFSSATLSDIDIRATRRQDNDLRAIHSAVQRILSDIVQLLNQVGKVTILSESSVTNEKGSKRSMHTSDFWTVCFNGRSILVVGVKTPLPGTTSDDDGSDKLADPNVLGQMHDFLINKQNFYGATHIFGIVTTMKHWTFVWLPESTALAQSPILPVAALGQCKPVNRLDSRIVCTSKIFQQDDESLPRLLMSLFKKAQCTSFQSVSLLTTTRMYVCLSSDSWQWMRPTQEEVNAWSTSLTLQLVSQPSPVAEFLVLKHLQLDAEAKVWLALIHNTILAGTICVVKQMYDLKDAAREASLWSRVNGGTVVAARLVSARPSVVVPFVVLATESNIDRKSKQVQFIFDAAQWGLQDNVLPGEIPVHLKANAEAIQAVAASANLLNARFVAQAAVVRIAKKGLLHKDIEWRHVALVPEFDVSGAVVRLMPGLIDLESVVEADPAEALAAMTERIEEISRDVTVFGAI